VIPPEVVTDNDIWISGRNTVRTGVKTRPIWGFTPSMQDFKYAIWTMARAPLFVLVIVLTTALAIGTNTTIFTIINAIFRRPIPIEDPSSLVRIYTVDAKNVVIVISAQLLSQILKIYRDKNSLFSGM